MNKRNVRPKTVTIPVDLLKKWYKQLEDSGCGNDCIYSCGDLYRELTTMTSRQTRKAARR